jgi:signal transduction histidine kinase
LLTAAAHDLKNSLASITMRADLLQEQLHDDSRAPRRETPIAVSNGLARIQATSANMARSLDELLGLARIRAGHRLDLVLEPMDRWRLFPLPGLRAWPSRAQSALSVGVLLWCSRVT